MSPPTAAHTRIVDERLLDRAFRRSNAPRWNLTRESFARALDRSVSSRFATEAGASPQSISDYVDSLNLEELALACACADGQVSAWSFFLECYRPGLRAAARVIAGNDSGEDLADSIYAELYGLEERDGCRRSLFDYFHGRSRLSTWLRSILAQRNIDRARAAKRIRPLEEAEDAGLNVRPARDPGDQERRRFAEMAQQALALAIRRLAAPDRLRLSAYYLQRLTLAQIGRMTGEHEATVSRRLDRIRRDLRSAVERLLRDTHHLGDAQVRACLDAALDDVGLDLDAVLDGEGGKAVAGKNGRVDRSEGRSAM
jgi:RNA polymerase sigma-70 factor (ECF subfamily)